MKNRILCILFLHYQDFFTSFCKNWQWCFHLQNTSHFHPMFKNKTTHLSPIHIKLLLSCIQLTMPTNYCWGSSVCGCTTVSSCTQRTQSVKTEVFCSVPVSLSKQFLTFQRIHSLNCTALYPARLQPMAALLWPPISHITIYYHHII